MQNICLKVGKTPYTVEANIIQCGRDLNICIAGGDTYHIGAAALAIPRPSLADARQTSASVSVFCVTGHKEDELARNTALLLASQLNTRVIVTCGLHIDNATTQDIQILYENYLLLTNQIIDSLLLK